MLYYIKPDNGINKFYNEIGAEITDATIEQVDKKYVEFKVDDYSKRFKKHLLEFAENDGTYIKINTEGKKISRVDRITKNAPNMSVHSAVMAELAEDVEIMTMSQYTFDDSLMVPIKVGGVLSDFFSTEGGIYPGVKILVNGEPGTLKSSNMYQLLQNTAKENPDKKVLYVSAEMGALDAKRSITKWYTEAEKLVSMAFPGEYLGGNEQGINATQYLLNVLSQGWDIVVLDSLKIIQQMLKMENNFSSDEKAEQWLLALLDRHSKRAENKRAVNTSFLIIQQSNKSGSIAGSAALEYMLNGTLMLKVDRKLRGAQYMEFKKNRSGQKEVRLYFDAVKSKGIVYNELKYRAELELRDIISGANIEEGDEPITGSALADILSAANKAGKVIREVKEQEELPVA